MAYLHGVYVYEQATPITPPVQVDSAVQIAIGTTPVNMGTADDPMAPQIHYSYDEALKKIGYSSEFKNYTISEVVKASFEVYNVAPIVTINALNPDEHVTAVISDTVILTEKRAVLEQQGVIIDGLTIMSKDGDKTYEAEKDYTASFNNSGHLVIDASLKESAIPAGTQTLKLSYKQLDPSKVTKQDILSAIRKVRQVYPIFNIVPCILLCPGWSHDPEIYMALTANAINLNTMFQNMVLADIGTDEAPEYDKVNSVKNQNGITNANSIALWPMCRVGDALLHMSSLTGAHIAYTDYLNEGVPYVSPSNKSLKISGICDKNKKPIILDKEMADLLNSQGVCTAINQNGWRFWGNRTAAYPATTDPKDSFISVRRMFIWWGATFILTYFQKVDDPTNRRLIESVVDSENIRANGFKSRLQIADAQMIFDINENPQTDILNGHIRFRQKLTPYPPAEAIINVLEFDPNALTDALSMGG